MNPLNNLASGIAPGQSIQKAHRGAIDTAMDSLYSQLDSLDYMINCLHDALAPALSPPTPQAVANAPEPISCCPLEGALLNAERRLSLTKDTLSALFQRIQL